jgi:hypothetical protein
MDMPSNRTNEYMRDWRLPLFELDDTDLLEDYRGEIECLPQHWGYSKEEGEAIFPDVIYPKCEEVLPSRGQYIRLQPDGRTFEMNCKGEVSKVYFGPSEKKKLSKGRDYRGYSFHFNKNGTHKLHKMVEYIIGN